VNPSRDERRQRFRAAWDRMDSDFPSHVTITREFHDDGEPAPAPLRPRYSRTVAVGSTGCTLTQEIFDDDGPVEDAHYRDVDRHREREAAEITRAARRSITHPDHLAGRGTNDND
jgi:hypothetical protein